MKYQLLTCALACSLAAFAHADTLSGTIQQIQDVPGYTYLLVSTTNGPVWAAVNQTPLKVGAPVTISNTMLMHDFKSPTLHKTFATIVFGTVGVSTVMAQQTASGNIPASMHAGIVDKAPKLINVSRSTAVDGHRVADVVTHAAELNGKSVTIHAMVVKFNPDIMGRNWLHVRDGSGKDQDGSNDILVTSSEGAKVGSVVTIHGTVVTNQDFGSGYAYKVMVEHATIK